jgi:hypothetical protein
MHVAIFNMFPKQTGVFFVEANSFINLHRLARTII